MSDQPLSLQTVVVGLFSLLHIALAAPAVAFMVLAPMAEAAGLRRPFFTDHARTITRFTVVTFAASSVLAVFMIELFVGLFPLTNRWLFNQFRLPLYAGSAAFVLMAVLLLAYFFWWDAIRAKSARLHIALGSLAALGALIWAALLDGMGSYMLTPVTGDSTWGSLVNPTWIPLMLHRLGGDLSLAGYLAAGYAAAMLRRRGGHPDEPYYLHFFKIAFVIGLLGLLLQPLTGLLYAVRIEAATPDAYARLIAGGYRGWVYAQFTLIGILFAGTYGIVQSAGPSHSHALWRSALVGLSAVLMVLFVGQPNVRRVFTFLLIGLTLWPFIAWRRRLATLPAAAVSRPLMRLTALMLALASLLTYLTMGVIRETTRRPDTVNGMISLRDEARARTAAQ